MAIDVLPEHVKPDDWPSDQLWLPKPHESIPGSYWYPRAGLANISEEEEAWHINQWTQLAKEKGSDKGYLFFCRQQCWLSWNAGVRAIANGLNPVYWMPGGIEEWSLFDLPTSVIELAHIYDK